MIICLKWLSEQTLATLQGHQSVNPDELAYFAYDLDKLSEHLKALQDQDVIKLWYAVKGKSTL